MKMPRTPLTTRVSGMMLALTGALVIASFVGCTQPLRLHDTQLSIASRDRLDGRQIELTGESIRAIYRVEDKNSVTVLLIQGPDDNPRRVAALRMFWKARAGLTPVDRTATNALVRFFEFRDSPAEPGTLGVYAGAGFMRLHDDPNTARVSGTLWDADLRLTDRSEVFTDRLGRAIVAGSFTADRDDAAVTTLLRDLNQRVSDRLGYPRLVRHRGRLPGTG